MTGTLRNAIVFAGVVAGAVFASFALVERYAADSVMAFVKDVWPIQGMIGAAIIALATKLQDPSHVKGLTDQQSERIQRTVTVKTYRLFSLVFLLIASALLARVPLNWIPDAVVHAFAAGVVSASLTGIVLAVWIVPMWLELRRFLVEVKRFEEERERRERYLERFRADEHKEASPTKTA